ncbi:type II toxin-antitoxin system RelE/ParE family toxin [Polyangium spumosum]|uniref:Type II toxin-antitoxin system RelE/ParE family toxin n=1 Tax=Polyangium spumosum TaxID=889282 RepID=A0A6N7PKI1_9BACT|nr:hypothetical protein [Polyangium spumosum]
MKVVFLGRSAAQARAVEAWWRDNQGSSSLFTNELALALRLLKRAPEMGAPYAPRADRGVRRLLLRRTQYHIYYVYDRDKKVIGVLAIWSCLRGKPPKLG